MEIFSDKTVFCPQPKVRNRISKQKFCKGVVVVKSCLIIKNIYLKISRDVDC